MKTKTKRLIALFLAIVMCIPNIAYAKEHEESKISKVILDVEDEGTSTSEKVYEVGVYAPPQKGAVLKAEQEVAAPNNLVAQMDTYYYVHEYIFWITEEGILTSYRDGETEEWQTDVEAFTISKTHIIALKMDGSIYCLRFGSNSHIVDLMNELEENPIGKITYAYAGGNFTYLINEAGELYGFGENGSAQLGVGHTNAVNGLVKMMDNVYKATASHGPAYSCYYIITKGGMLYSWGSNRSAGPGSIGTNYSPVLVDTEHGLTKDVESGYTGSIAISNSGYMTAWGYSFSGGFTTPLYETGLNASDIAFSDDTLGDLYYVFGGSLYSVGCGWGMGDPVYNDSNVETVIYGYCGTCLYQKTDGSIYQLVSPGGDINPLNITAKLAKTNPTFPVVDKETVTNNEFVIQLVDKKTGELISDVPINIDGKDYYASENGNYYLTDTKTKAKAVDIRIEKEGYVKKVLEKYSISAKAPTVLSLFSLDSVGVYEAYVFHHNENYESTDINGQVEENEKTAYDVFNGMHVFTLDDPDEKKISIRYQTAIENVQKVQLLQAGNVIQEYDVSDVVDSEGEFYHTLGVGYFLNIEKSKLQDNVGLYIRVTALDENKKEVYYAEKLNVKIVSLMDIDNTEFQLELKDGKLEIQLPSDWMIIGNLKFGIDMTDLPLYMKVSDGKIYGGIGFDIEKEEDVDEMKLKDAMSMFKSMGFENGMKKLEAQEFDVAAKNTFSGGLKPTTSRTNSIFGYLIYDLETGGMDAEIYWEFGGKMEKCFSFSLAGVPMVVGGTSSQTAKMTIGATLDWESDSFSPDVFIKEFEFKPLDIRLYVGPGISKNVKAVVYGQGGVKGKIIPDSTYLGLYGDLECGVSVKFFFIEADQPYKSEKDILIWEKYLDRENTGRTRTTLQMAARDGLVQGNTQATEAMLQIANRNYLENMSSWNGMTNRARAAITSNQLTPLLTSTYENPSAKMIPTQDGAMMVWIGDKEDRADVDRFALYYSVYDASTFAWSEPALVEDNETADFSPTIVTDGTDIYVAWADMKASYGNSVDIEDGMKQMEIKVAKYNAQSGAFDAVYCVTDNNAIDVTPELKMTEDGLVVFWTECDMNAIMGAEQGITNLNYALLDKNGTLSSMKTIQSGIAGFGQLKAGDFGDYDYAYTVLKNTYTDDVQDKKLILGTISGETNTVAEGMIGDFAFNTATQEELFFYQEGSNLKYMTTSEESKVIDSAFTGSEIFVVDKNGKTSLVYITSEEGKAVIGCYDYNGTKWDDATVLGTFGADNAYALSSVAGYYDGEKYHFIAVSDESVLKTEEDTAVLTNVTNINDILCVGGADLTLELNDYELLNEGTELSADLLVKNVSKVEISSVTVKLKDADGDVLATKQVELNLAKDTEVETKVTLELETPVDALGTYELEVLPDGVEDVYTFDNRQSIELGYSDYRMETSIIQCDGLIRVTSLIYNEGQIASKGRYIITNVETQEIVHETQVEEIPAGASMVLTYVLDDTFTDLNEYHQSKFQFEFIPENDNTIPLKSFGMLEMFYMEESEEPEKPSVDVTTVFEDVYKDAWFEDAAQFVYDKGIMSGSDGKFSPDNAMTRAMMVTTLYRLAGEPEVSDDTATKIFPDVEKGAWYENPVNWAYTTKITTGYTDAQGNPTRFGSDDSVTREQLAVFFYRFAAKEGYNVTVKADISKYVGYSDVGDYALDAMEWAVGIGLISGIEYNQDGVTVRDLSPKGSATRAQLATILMRFCNYYHV